MLAFRRYHWLSVWETVIFGLNIRAGSGKATIVASKIVDVDNGCVKIEVRNYRWHLLQLAAKTAFLTNHQMTNPLRYFITILMLVAVCMLTLHSTAFGQQFRQPAVPGIQGGNALPFGAQDTFGVQNTYGPQDTFGPAPSGLPQPAQYQDFVPRKSDGGLGLVPVRPRGNNNSNKSVGDGSYLQDALQGRSSEQERILDQIRSGNFESNGGVRQQPGKSQVIRQRYDNGKDQLVRHVAQDSDGNYFNHGPWSLYNRQGEQVATGQFVNGAMDGTWERWHRANSGGMFSTPSFSQFQGPFLSTATFTQGKLNGVWVITDRARRKVVEVSYRNGKREGTAIWWLPNGKKFRVINFRNGELDGPLFEWNEQQQLVRNEEYIRGQKVIRQTTSYRPQQKSAEAYYLDAKIELSGEDSWWDAQPADYEQSGERTQHGPSFAWYTNGQRKMVGQYREDVRVGDFKWWHENGQRALAGRYDDGLKQGGWTWWHDNGIKAIEGVYESDKPVGQWTWWDEEGQVSNQEDYGDGSDSTGELINPFEDELPPETTNPVFDDAEDENEIDLAPPADIDVMEEIRPDEIPDDPILFDDINL